MTRFALSLIALPIATVLLFSGCSSNDDDSPRMTLGERWRAMAERQDEQARAFVADD